MSAEATLHSKVLLLEIQPVRRRALVELDFFVYIYFQAL
jgi:hypothetical protein